MGHFSEDAYACKLVALQVDAVLTFWWRELCKEPARRSRLLTTLSDLGAIDICVIIGSWSQKVGERVVRGPHHSGMQAAADLKDIAGMRRQKTWDTAIELLESEEDDEPLRRHGNIDVNIYRQANDREHSRGAYSRIPEKQARSRHCSAYWRQDQEPQAWLGRSHGPVQARQDDD
jgi:hypothetical protein